KLDSHPFSIRKKRTHDAGSTSAPQFKCNTDSLDYDSGMPPFLERYSSEVAIVMLGAMVMATLLVLVPKILRNQQKIHDDRHAESRQRLAKGLPLPSDDHRTRAAGRTASLVPIVTVIVAGTVTCFLVAFRSDSLLSVTIAVWSVAGVVCLAAITGGVALLGRLAHVDFEEEDEKDNEKEKEKEKEKKSV